MPKTPDVLADTFAYEWATCDHCGGVTRIETATYCPVCAQSPEDEIRALRAENESLGEAIKLFNADLLIAATAARVRDEVEREDIYATCPDCLIHCSIERDGEDDWMHTGRNGHHFFCRAADIWERRYQRNLATGGTSDGKST